MNTNTGVTADSEMIARTREPAKHAATKARAVKPKTATPSKAGKVGRPLHSSRSAAKSGKLVCRYCGSDDLAPSFKKRRDARCRACFKKRYGSTAQRRQTKRSRKAKGAK